MASKLFFDPLVALRAAPLVSATCTLLYAYDQHFFLGLLNRPDTRQHSRPLLPAFFRSFFREGVVFVVAMLAVTTWGSVANLYVNRPSLSARGSFGWYVAGAVLSSSHLLFVPGVAPSIKRITGAEAGGEEDVNADLDEWLGVNKVRMLTVDLAAWVACVVAVGKSLSA
ncbi:hypothetical protein CONLIGDRAFT_266872 [Coniochaeta ligniaria NRRL 30616]|uniref:DUF1772-domain-containing protein n=1 Tax=Coniochaeta ligniaria NRRL 30616 TaxID=1408157 RepID=A0A1J7JX36_9PEZI|nr:hypothetical protein CONLIGDRAFT_266872 [Coniochaeta ligniaria NRRL 30616]